jgi:hypothetical protein
VNFGVAGNVGAVAARMVLYAGSASAPSGAYIAQSSGANFSLQAGTIIYPTPELTNVALSAGQVYWVGIVTQVDTTLRRDSAGTQTACRQWGQSFSAAFGNAQAGNGLASALNLFIQVRDTK